MIARSIIRPVVTGTILVLLGACSPQPQREHGDTDTARPEGTDPVSHQELTRHTLTIDLLSDPRYHYVRSLLNQQSYSEAIRALNAMDAGLMSADSTITHHLVRRRILEADNRYYAALETIGDPTLSRNLSSASPQLQRLHATESADLLARTGNYLAAAELLINAADNTEKGLWSDKIWWFMSQANVITRPLTSSVSPTSKAWFSLAELTRDNSGGIRGQMLSLERWLRDYPNHEANPIAVKLYAGYRYALADLPDHVALLLPLTGQLAETGQAVRDGFLAEHYRLAARGHPVPTISIYDTMAQPDIISAYESAVGQGAELIVGPLLKSNVSALIEEANPVVPILALNRVDQSADNVYQMSLSPEDEVSQLARAAGMRSPGNALLIRPQGSWGDKVEETLDVSWQTYGNEIAARAVYGSGIDLSTAIKEALDLTSSENRAQELTRILGIPSEFTPRRRADIDAIFILSSRSEEIRNVRPMLSFHYAGDLPVYAMAGPSHGVQPNAARDMDGLVFTGTPWELNRDNPLLESILQYGGQPALSGMYALGADGYRMYPQLGMSPILEGQVIHAHTGALRLDNNNRFQRSLSIAKINNGRFRVEASLPIQSSPPFAELDDL